VELALDELVTSGYTPQSTLYDHVTLATPPPHPHPLMLRAQFVALNYRSKEVWDLPAQEMATLSARYGIAGAVIKGPTLWGTVFHTGLRGGGGEGEGEGEATMEGWH